MILNAHKKMSVCHYFFNRNAYYLFYQVRKKFGRLNPGQICQVLTEYKNGNDFVLKILKINFFGARKLLLHGRILHMMSFC